MFSSTYTRESLFSLTNLTKSNERNALTEETIAARVLLEMSKVHS